MSVLRSIAISLLLASLPLAASAQPDPITTDLVPLMPVVKTLEADLKLNAAQERVLLAWRAEAPATRQHLEHKLRQQQLRMREAILGNEPRLVREQLKKDLLATEKQLIELTALCVRMLRTTLTPEQFTTVVKAYRAGLHY